MGRKAALADHRFRRTERPGGVTAPHRRDHRALCPQISEREEIPRIALSGNPRRRHCPDHRRRQLGAGKRGLGLGHLGRARKGEMRSASSMPGVIGPNIGRRPARNGCELRWSSGRSRPMPCKEAYADPYQRTLIAAPTSIRYLPEELLKFLVIDHDFPLISMRAYINWRESDERAADDLSRCLHTG